jgi:hypothetical protein
VGKITAAKRTFAKIKQNLSQFSPKHIITNNPNMADINTNIPKETNILTKIEEKRLKGNTWKVR